MTTQKITPMKFRRGDAPMKRALLTTDAARASTLSNCSPSPKSAESHKQEIMP